MIFVVICKDKPGHLQVRKDTRPDHITYLTGLNEQGKLKFAGPFLDAEGKPTGSMVAFEVPDIDTAKALATDDPYAKAGLFESVEIRAWNWGFNPPEAK